MTQSLPSSAIQKLQCAAGKPSSGEGFSKSSVGKYRLIREIARGGMGIVYEAEDTDLKRRVAVKIGRELPGMDEMLWQRFHREAQAAAGLAHPNLVTVYDAGQEEGRPYIVMELVEGRPLSALLKEGNHDLGWMIGALQKAAIGLAAAHDQGIVHRDVKPANILVTKVGEPKVGDFGLVHHVGVQDGLTKTGTILGTPRYMAPEQVEARTREFTPRTDVHALGVILYEILTGQTPYAAENEMEICMKILSEDPRRPRRLNRHVPRDLETIALKALEKDPNRRYANAREFAEDLQRYLEGRPILAHPLSAFYRTMKFVRRRKDLFISVAATLGAVLAIGIISAEVAKAKRFQRLKEKTFAAYNEENWLEAQGLCVETVEIRNDWAVLGLLKECRIRIESSEKREQQRRSAIAYNLRGSLKQDRGDLGGALSDYDEAIRSHPQYAPAYSNRGRLRRKKGDLEEAMSDFTEALRLDPDLAEAYFYRGTLQDQNGNFREALSDYDAALRLDERYRKAYLRRAILRKKNGKWVKAIEDFTHALAIAPDSWHRRKKVERLLADVKRRLASGRKD